MRVIDHQKDFVSEKMAKELYAEGIKFESIFYWDGGYHVASWNKLSPEAVPAPSTGEVFMYLPAHLKSGYTLYLMKNHTGSYFASYRRKRGKVYRPEFPGHVPSKLKRRLTSHRASSPADALASLLLWMKKSKWFDLGRWDNDTP